MKLDNIFFKVWRNNYIKNIIFNYLRKFNFMFYYELEINKIELKDKLYKFTFLNYLKNVSLDCTSRETILPNLPVSVNKLQLNLDPNNTLKRIVVIVSKEAIKENKYSGIDYFPITISSIPESITDLTITSSKIHYEIHDCNLIPSTIQKLKLCFYNGQFMHDNKNIIPFGPTQLILESFNNNVSPFSLPESLTLIKFSYDFNCELLENSIPKSTTSLDLGMYYDFELTKEIIPPNLIYFKQSLFNSKDNSFQIISNKCKSLSLSYKQSNNNYRNNSNNNSSIVFSSIKSSISNYFNKFSNNSTNNNNNNNTIIILPDHLIKIQKLNQEYILNIKFNHHIRKIEIVNLFDCSLIQYLPNSLEKVRITSLTNDKRLNEFQFPNSITSLETSLVANLSRNLPNNLKYFKIQRLREHFTENDLPNHQLFHLEFINPLNNLMKGCFSTGYSRLIKSLKFTADYYRGNLSKIDLPVSLTNLELSVSQFDEISHLKNLKSLVALKLSIKYFYYTFKDDISDQFPDSLTLLELGGNLKSFLSRVFDCQGGLHNRPYQICNEWIPKNVKNLVLWGNANYIQNQTDQLIPDSIYIHNINKFLYNIINNNNHSNNHNNNNNNNTILNKFKILDTIKMEKIYKKLLQKYLKNNK